MGTNKILTYCIILNYIILRKILRTNLCSINLIRNAFSQNPSLKLFE